MSTPSTTADPWSLSGKSAVVTGASRGIGKAIAIHLARKGLENIAITYASNKAAADDTLEACRALGVKKATAIRADALDPAVWPGVITQSLADLGVDTIHILVNNAVLGDPAYYRASSELTPDSFASVMLANVYAPVATAVAFMEHAAPKNAGGGGGRVINISSISGTGTCAEPLMTYGASKAALDSYTRSLADTYASDRGITFNSVIVGPTATDALHMLLSELPTEAADKLIFETSAAPRFGEPDDIAYIVGFLASEEGRTTLAALG
ncbi:hypothetical protein KVR01_010850 [Diaporthe batatas]|uniref:uncharacterized protein n=1 Tax=Diaporthe batatas TaxID=748121 RepID=UPI001D04C30F|nr:uncharacterized protein KVR01_010850 [Diaporthe batatas]KAG8159189.1 hypothetical protein KVR01_010850 [Diaporthe batatas]